MTQDTLPKAAIRPFSGRALPRPARRFGAGVLVVAVAFSAVGIAAARPAPNSFADMAERVAPAVVNVQVVKKAPAVASFEGQERMPQRFGPDHPLREFFERFMERDLPEFGGPQQRMPQGRPQAGLGSGFIIDAKGFVVTNHHVVAGADEISVTLHDGTSLEAELVGQDRKTDLALLKVEHDKDLPFVAFGDSDVVRPGDWVFAVGNPFGLGGTVTAGIVSARGRDLPGGTIIDFLQIDAPINRGNSGGPAFNMNGEVIGVNTAIYSPSGGSVGIGFAIPANLVEEVVSELRENGGISRGWLGVRIQAVTPEIAEGFGLEATAGALVAAVEADSPAAKAGLKAGDVILSWNGDKVLRLKDLPRLVAFTEAGEKVKVEVWRDRDATTLEVVSGTAPEPKQIAAKSTGSSEKAGQVALGGTGITVADLTAEHRRAFEIGEDVSGVVIVGVEADSPADREGLRRGDVIRSLASEPVESAEAAAQKIEQASVDGQDVVAFLVSRQGVDRFMAVRLKDA